MPRLLDLYCGAGGAAMGYYQAGFTEIVGIDIKPQRRYPFTFIQGDALCPPVDLSCFDAIHASPPCQFGSEATPMEARLRHPNLIPQTRALLEESGRPYVIENVENVRRHLRQGLMLCGTMFKLPIWRHRYFEISPFPSVMVPPCNHRHRPITIHTGSNTRKTYEPVLCSGGADSAGQVARGKSGRKLFRPRERVDVVRVAMEIPWMSQGELTEAIPPAYTEFIGRHLIKLCR